MYNFIFFFFQVSRVTSVLVIDRNCSRFVDGDSFKPFQWNLYLHHKVFLLGCLVISDRSEDLINCNFNNECQISNLVSHHVLFEYLKIFITFPDDEIPLKNLSFTTHPRNSLWTF